MSYQLILHPDVEEEIYHQAHYYEGRFSSGQEDFIVAITDTLEEIENFPHLGLKRFPKRDAHIRSRKIKPKTKQKSYARKFPFALVYKTYEEKQTILVYQLWPMKSGLPIRKPPTNV